MPIRNIITAIVKRYGSTEAKKKVWDAEFARGKWKYLEEDGQDPIYDCLNRYANSGKLLDLGCGTGITGNFINRTLYATYTGVDISGNAIKEARERVDPERNEKNNYVTADIARYIPEGKFSVILFRESIYYLPESDVKNILTRYRDCLDQQGVFIVRLHDKLKFAGIVKIIEHAFNLIEKIDIQPGGNIIVFR
jgi:SAM-dependent methyltransferase